MYLRYVGGIVTFLVMMAAPCALAQTSGSGPSSVAFGPPPDGTPITRTLTFTNQSGMIVIDGTDALKTYGMQVNTIPDVTQTNPPQELIIGLMIEIDATRAYLTQFQVNFTPIPNPFCLASPTPCSPFFPTIQNLTVDQALSTDYTNVTSTRIPGRNAPSLAWSAQTGQIARAIEVSLNDFPLGSASTFWAISSATLTFVPISGSTLDLAVSTPTLLDQNGKPLTPNSSGQYVVSPGTSYKMSVPYSWSGLSSSNAKGSTNITIKDCAYGDPSCPGEGVTSSDPIDLSTLTVPSGHDNILVMFTVPANDAPGLHKLSTVINDDRSILESDSNDSQAIQVMVAAPLKIISAQAIQSVPNVNLVKGKNTAIQATVTAEGADPSDSTPILVTATLPDGTTLDNSAQIPEITVGQAAAAAPSGVVATMLTWAPGSTASAQAISLVAQAGSSPPSDPYWLPIVVQEANQLNIAYFPLTAPGESLFDFSGHVATANEYFKAMYPIAEDGLVYQTPGPITASSADDIASGDQVNQDLGILAYYGSLSPGVQAAVGVASDSYFADRGWSAGTLGVARQPFTSCQTATSTYGAIVEEGYYDVTTHEVAHTFGLEDLDSAPNTAGYWVDRGQPISDFYDLMTAPPEIPFASMPFLWPSTSEYGCLLRALLAPSADPQVLVVAGFMDRSNSIELLPFQFLPNGVATPFNATADGNVQLLDSSGTVVGQGSFISSYSLVANTGERIPTSSTFFLTTLPFSQSVASLRIQEKGATVYSINPSTKLLVDTINGIPQTSFIRNAKQGAQKLLKRTEQIDGFMRGCVRLREAPAQTHCDDRVFRSLLELREDVVESLNDSTVLANPGQVTKQKVLYVVDLLGLYAIPNMEVMARDHSFDIQILPTDEDAKTPVFHIASVTQGAHGSVFIERDGTIEYKPESTQIAADTFAVTINNAEGATVTKTVAIVPPPAASEAKSDRFQKGAAQ